MSEESNMKPSISVKKKLPKRIKFLIGILCAILVALTVIWAIYSDVIILRKTEDMVGSDNAIAILFVGNSHVFVNDVPRQLQIIAEMHDVEIIYKIISRHGATLSDSMHNAIEEIQSRKFDYVVLQDQGRRPQNDIEGFLEDVQILCNKAKENEAIPVLYSPAWAMVDAHPDERLLNISTKAYEQAAVENDTILVNASDAWIYAYQEIPGISLYTRLDPRGPHATKAGAFLTACVFAATIFDLHIEEIPQDNYYKENDAIDLAKIAWEFVRLSYE